MIKHNNSHRRALEKIVNHPEKFGFNFLTDISSISIEKKLYHQGRVLCEPDVTINYLNGEVHIVEYKGNGEGNGEMFERSRKQLEEARWWYGRYRKDIPPEKIHTHLISGNDPKYKDLLRNF